MQTMIKQVRQLFADHLPEGYSVKDATMRYVHPNDGHEWQVLTFRVIDPHGHPHVWTSEQVRSRDDIYELAIRTAKKFVEEEIGDGPSDGVDATNGGQRSQHSEDPESSGR